jgi:hypothetical protein
MEQGSREKALQATQNAAYQRFSSSLLREQKARTVVATLSAHEALAHCG